MIVVAVAVGICQAGAAGGVHEAIVTQEFIFERAPFAACHASTLVEVRPGEILAAWFGGSAEGHKDVAIWLARRDANGWSPPLEVARQQGIPCWNPVLWKDGKTGELLLFYKAGPSPDTWSGLLSRSRDDGRTWSKPEMLPAGVLGPVKNKPLQLDDGSLLCGSSAESWNAWGCWCEVTPDLGKTWSKGSPINLSGDRYGVIQPTIFRSGTNELRMLMRARSQVGRICTATSKDGGKTWTDASPTELPNPNSGIDAVGLADGRAALVYNHTVSGRSPLNLAVSPDGGKTWDPALRLEDEPKAEFSYPAVILTRDGRIATTYTWKRKRIRFVLVDPARLP